MIKNLGEELRDGIEKWSAKREFCGLSSAGYAECNRPMQQPVGLQACWEMANEVIAANAGFAA
jgi:hypothetical protein